MRWILCCALALTACQKGEPPPTVRGGTPATALPATARQTAWGFDTVVRHQRPGATCWAGTRYVVVARDLADQVGEDLHVRPRGALTVEPPCAADSLPGDIVFRTGDVVGRHPDAQYFLGLKGDLLLAGDGTGGRTDLYVYDLQKRAKVLEVDGIDDTDLRWPGPTTLTVWVTKAHGEGAAAAGCPDTLPANPPQLDSLMSLDLGALTLGSRGPFRCTIGQ